MTDTRTDAEVICEFMEPKPTMIEAMAEGWSFKWWGRDRRPCCELTLDRLREIESKIMARTDPVPPLHADWGDVIDTAYCNVAGDEWHYHLSAEQKTRALASVLREQK